LELTPHFVAFGLLWYVVFIFSTTCHEAAHAFAAWRLGDSTAYEGGQVTLNPLPHIQREPWGMILVPLLSYAVGGWMIGWASAPYNPHWALRYPKRSAMMALAGPLANFAIALVAGVGIRLGLGSGLFGPSGRFHFADFLVSSSGWPQALAAILGIAFMLNLLLGIFNLIPFPPLDGSAVLLFFLPEGIARRYQEFLWSQPMLAWAGILLAWKIFPYIFRPMMLFGVWLLSGLRYG